MLSTEDLEQYESEIELALYREYRDVVGLFRFVVETERRFTTGNTSTSASDPPKVARCSSRWSMSDAWVWDIYRQARFVKNVRVLRFQGRQRRGARPLQPGAPQGR